MCQINKCLFVFITYFWGNSIETYSGVLLFNYYGVGYLHFEFQNDFSFNGYLFQCDRLNPSPSRVFFSDIVMYP